MNPSTVSKLVSQGYLHEKGTPLICLSCGCPEIEETIPYYEDHYLVEYSLRCLGCDQLFATWTYGVWLYQMKTMPNKERFYFYRYTPVRSPHRGLPYSVFIITQTTHKRSTVIEMDVWDMKYEWSQIQHYRTFQDSYPSPSEFSRRFADKRCTRRIKRIYYHYDVFIKNEWLKKQIRKKLQKQINFALQSDFGFSVSL